MNESTSFRWGVKRRFAAGPRWSASVGNRLARGLARILRTYSVAAALGLIGAWAAPSQAADLIQLTEENWDQWVPAGKEVDCIYGDILLANDQIVAVVGRPVATRNANMTVRNVGGCVLDLTERAAANDQLSAFYPGGGAFALRELPDQAPGKSGRSGTQVQYSCLAEATDEAPQLRVTYVLADGDDALTIQTEYHNPGSQAIPLRLTDAIRADRSFDFQSGQSGHWMVCHDSWWRQAYAVVTEDYQIKQVGDTWSKGRPVWRYSRNDQDQWELNPGETIRTQRRLIPATSELEVIGRVERPAGSEWIDVQWRVLDEDGPVELARIDLARDGAPIGSARTGPLPETSVSAAILPGTYSLTVTAPGREPITVERTLSESGPVALRIPAAGRVKATITDGDGQRIAGKIELRRTDGVDPEFGPDTFITGIRNLRYVPGGEQSFPLAPGTYQVIVSHGPEYDAAFTEMKVVAGQTSELTARLPRVVDTTGWVSSDFHSHSTPSGDNTSSQRGRVLNLLAEHIEFAPCTEHNRISTYIEHLEYFAAVHRMATCSGMELTGSPLPINHQNAFPLRYTPRIQDGGAPVTDSNPIVQIERLAMWDDGSEKLVQSNHPHLVQMHGDRDLDGKADGGFRQMFQFMDVVEVHPPQDILLPPDPDAWQNGRGNVIFNWMQLLNLGYRIPGVVNTDAHYNFHGSGFLRNYIRSTTDDPAALETMDMVRAAEHGQMVMTNGPFLEVQVRGAAAGEDRPAAGPGDDLALTTEDAGRVRLAVRVQCPNWLDVNRIQLMVNGVPHAESNFRRAEQSKGFGGGVVKFDATWSVSLESDSHLIVAAAGEGLQLGPVVGPAHAEEMPIAVSNPVFVDVDGGGFQANGDLMGVPLPGSEEALPAATR